MAVANISVTLKGQISSTPATCNGVGSSGSSGPTFRLELPASAQSATNDAHSTVQTIDSAGALASIDWPSSLRAQVFYIKVLTASPMTIELTFEITGIVVVPLLGPMLLALPPDDRISDVRIQGQGNVEWFASGGIV